MKSDICLNPVIRKSKFNYELRVLYDLLSSYTQMYQKIPNSLKKRLEQLMHDIDFVYDAEPEWLENYDIIDTDLKIIYSLKPLKK